MKDGCNPKRNVLWVTVRRLAAGAMVLLWMARWFVRLMPRAIGGEGVYAWSELAVRTYRVVERWEK